MDEDLKNYVLVRNSLLDGIKGQFGRKTDIDLTDYVFFRMYKGVEEWVYKDDLEIWKLLINKNKRSKYGCT